MVASLVSESALTDVFIPNSQKMPNPTIANDPDEHFLGIAVLLNLSFVVRS